jgi:hypothetical protein
MIPKRIRKSDIGVFLGDLSKEYVVFVPVMEEVVLFKKLHHEEFTFIEYHNFYIPPLKHFLFPPIWSRFIPYKYYEEYETQDNEKKAIFGLRPCDAQGLILLDKVLRDNEIYKDKRNKIFIIVIGCNTPR